jgi:hypothetical protein
VALLQRSEALSLDRVDALRDLEKRQPTAPKEEGIAHIEDLDALYGGEATLERRLQPFQGRLVLLDPRSGAVTPVEGAPAGARPLHWSPDRARLLLSGRWRDGVQLFAWERASGDSEIQTAGPNDHSMGCFASDGRLVAVELERGAGAHGTTVGRVVAWPHGGGAATRISNGPFDVQPACSATRPQVAFSTVDDAGAPAIAVVDLDRPGERHLVARGLAPVYTPDGEWIVYVGKSTAGQRLFRVRHDGTGRAPVGAGLEEESHPAVSPDGRYVAYVAIDENRRERLWVRRFDGSGNRLLLSQGDGAWPAW